MLSSSSLVCAKLLEEVLKLGLLSSATVTMCMYNDSATYNLHEFQYVENSMKDNGRQCFRFCNFTSSFLYLV